MSHQQPSLFGLPSDEGRPTVNEPPVDAPLAARMRPRTLDEIIGQEHLLAPGHALRRLIEQDHITSMIFWGPPGSGKTTLAEVIAHTTHSHFVSMSAVTAGVADLRRVVDEAQRIRRASKQRTILFLDEIHRFNKSQQDSALPHVERGTIILIGATTENPSFEVNAALLSRCRVFTLHALTDDNIRAILERALTDKEQGLGQSHLTVDDDALAYLATYANGDARMALTALEVAANSTPPTDHHITLAIVEDALQQRSLLYDKAGEEHYNLISALHKSVRGSDPDGAVYWLVRMLEAGEDPLYIARRIIRMASEDIGLADPQALGITVSAQQAVHFLGMPEGGIALAEAVIYLACAPKSNALERAYMAVQADVRAGRNEGVPIHLRNAPTRLMKTSGYGHGYVYSHDIYATIGSDPADPSRPPPAPVQPEGYLPDMLQDRHYYEPGEKAQGAEASIARWLTRRRGAEQTTRHYHTQQKGKDEGSVSSGREES
jgi:putative ATPase